jgi:hypothetical protein
MKTTSTLFFVAVIGGLVSCGGGGGSGSGSGATAATTVPKATISGTVLDKSGAPVSGVTVSAYYHNVHTTGSTTTGADGRYSFSGLDSTNTSVNQPPDYEIYAEKAGLAFYPSLSGSAGTITKFDFDGNYRTVIRFLGPPARDNTGNNFTAYRASDKVASLPRTGQTVSFAGGDDGASAKGVTWPGTRFADNANGTVTDQLTGLVWMKNAGCFAPSSWAVALAAANSLATGSCGLSDGSSAGQWRMPNINELDSLVDVSKFNPAVASAHPFTNIALASAYWSSTTYMALTTNAMAIRFSDGRWINGIDSGDGSFNNVKASASNGLWAVKSGNAGAVQLLATGAFYQNVGTVAAGGNGASFGARDDPSLQMGAPLTSPRFIDSGNGTLTDSMTGLVWLKKADCIRSNWAAALASANNLADGQCGLTDGSRAGQWRVPNRNEMLSIADRAPTFPIAEYFTGQAKGGAGPVTGPVVFQKFVSFDYYWTSTTTAANIGEAWTIWSCDFGAYNVAKSETRYALAVRSP